MLAERNSHDQLEALRRGELDLGFIHANPPPEGVSACDLVAEPFVVCLPDTHRLAGQRSLRLADLAGRISCFAQAASPSYYETVLSLCVAAGFHPAVRHEVRHWLSVAALVASGLGVSIVPSCLARARLAGACYVAFEHQARSVCQIAWPSLAPTSPAGNRPCRRRLTSFRAAARARLVQRNTTVLLRLSRMRCSTWLRTARDSTSDSMSLPTWVRSAAVMVWSTRSMSCSMMGPSSRSEVT